MQLERHAYLFIHKLDSHSSLQCIGRQQGQLGVAILQNTASVCCDVGGRATSREVIGPGDSQLCSVFVNLLVEYLDTLEKVVMRNSSFFHALACIQIVVDSKQMSWWGPSLGNWGGERKRPRYKASEVPICSTKAGNAVMLFQETPKKNPL